jgi:nickel-type superoxide dismutase maturation protease
MNQDGLIPAALPAPSWREWILWLLRRRMRVRITGESMQPTLLPGDIVLVDTHAYDNTLPTVSDILLARHPYQKDLIIIKRVVDLTPEGRLVLYSDNLRAGSDSRQLGTISMQRVIGRVTGVLRQRHST